MNFQLDYAKVVMQERMEEARQMRLLNEARRLSPQTPSLLSQLISRIRGTNTVQTRRIAQTRLQQPVECQ